MIKIYWFLFFYLGLSYLNLGWADFVTGDDGSIHFINFKKSSMLCREMGKKYPIYKNINNEFDFCPGGGDPYLDVKTYAIAACLANQEEPLLKKQGQQWAAGIVEFSNLGFESGLMLNLSETVKAEIAKNSMPIARSKSSDAHDISKMSIWYCVEVIPNTIAVRKAIFEVVAEFYETE